MKPGGLPEGPRHGEDRQKGGDEGNDQELRVALNKLRPQPKENPAECQVQKCSGGQISVETDTHVRAIESTDRRRNRALAANPALGTPRAPGTDGEAVRARVIISLEELHAAMTTWLLGERARPGHSALSPVKFGPEASMHSSPTVSHQANVPWR